MEHHSAEKWHHCQEPLNLLQLAVALAGVFLALLRILFGSIIWNRLVHKLILLPKHDLDKNFACLVQICWQKFLIRTSANCLHPIIKYCNGWFIQTITWNKEISPCLRFSVWYEGNYRWLFLSSSQIIYSSNCWLRKLTNIFNKLRPSGGSWWKWPGGLRNFISGWTYRIVALPLAVYNGVSSLSSSPKLIRLVIFSCAYWYIENIHFSLMKQTQTRNTNTKELTQPVPSKVWYITNATKAVKARVEPRTTRILSLEDSARLLRCYCCSRHIFNGTGWVNCFVFVFRVWVRFH